MRIFLFTEDEDEDEGEGDIKDVHWEAVEEVHQPGCTIWQKCTARSYFHSTTLYYTALHCTACTLVLSFQASRTNVLRAHIGHLVACLYCTALH